MRITPDDGFSAALQELSQSVAEVHGDTWTLAELTRILSILLDSSVARATCGIFSVSTSSRVVLEGVTTSGKGMPTAPISRGSYEQQLICGGIKYSLTPPLVLDMILMCSA